MKKNILFTILFILQGAFLISCDSYLEGTTPKMQAESSTIFNTEAKCAYALNGLYYQLGSYYFCGDYVIALGDFCSDIAVADPSSGHFVAENSYIFDENSGDLSYIWSRGYKIINGATKIINGVDLLLATEGTDTNSLYNTKAQAYALRAYAYFKLANIFCLPYNSGDTNEHGGLVLMDETPIEAEENVSRSSLTATYALIDKDITSALSAYENTTSNPDAYYFNKAAVNALKARVSLFEEKWEDAKMYAQEAIDLKGGAAVSNEDYEAMWSSVAINDEDIFTIVKSSDDNLSANSLNTLYGSYGATLTTTMVAEYADGDIRKAMIGTMLGNDGANDLWKYNGIGSAKAVSNIPQFRVSEMYLILAEANVRSTTPDLDAAREALLFVAKRNPAITSVADLPTSSDGLLTFISKERKRELCGEGFRFNDARRTGELIDVYDGNFTDFDVSKFVFPIPSDEINAGFGCEQNEGWNANLPK